MKKPELLAPAGSLEKLKIAVEYGADAVYFGGTEFSLRTAADNFTPEEMKEGLAFAHARGVKCYCAVNIFPRNDQVRRMGEYFKQLQQLGVDAVIVSDLGAFFEAQRAAPGLPIHVSTQANNVNFKSAAAWAELGASRVVLARELSFDEIRTIREEAPDVELECFVHGAMCISFSGRCLLSNYMAGRDSNQGACAHPCRWKYALVEEKRPGEYMEIGEDQNGTFLLNSKDMCMIEHIPELVAAGISSFKIEGRVKSAYYVAAVVNAYRMAIDQYFADPEHYTFDPQLLAEVEKVSHREYFTGFYFGDQKQEAQNYKTSGYIREYDIVAQVEQTGEDGLTLCTQKNRFRLGDRLEGFGPGFLGAEFEVKELYDGEGNPIEAAPHPEMKVRLKIPFAVKAPMMLRMQK